MIYALAVWRLSHMLVKEDGPAGVIAALREQLRAREVERSWFSTRTIPLHCVSCASIWVAAFLLVAPRPLLTLLAGSAIAKLIEDYFYAEPEPAPNNAINEFLANDENLASPFGVR